MQSHVQQNVGQAGIDAAELAQMNAEQQEKLDEATGKIEVRARARASAVARACMLYCASIVRPRLPSHARLPCAGLLAHICPGRGVPARLRDFASLSLVGMMTSFVAPVLSGGWHASVAPVED